jgi:putative transcriptional regulator
MKKDLFADLQEALVDARRFARGERLELRTTRLPPAPRPMNAKEIRRLRVRFGMSQAVFARALNVSPETVQSWEQGVRRPSGAALKLLRVAGKNPRVLAA